MTALSDFSENQLLKWLLTTTSIARPTTRYIALHTADPTETGSVGELSGNGYQRQAITFGAAADGSIQSSSSPLFGPATANWGSITHASIWDASSSGNCLAYGAFDAATSVLTNEMFTIHVGELVLAIAASGGFELPPIHETITTAAEAQTAINNCPVGKAIEFAPGTYNFASPLDLKSGVSLIGDNATLVATGTNGILSGSGVSDIVIANFIFDGGTSGGPGDTDGAIFLAQDGSAASGTYNDNIIIYNNTFQDWTTSNCCWIWHISNLYILHNTFTNIHQPVSLKNEADGTAKPMDNIVVAFNDISGTTRMAIETAFFSEVTNFHCDWNTLHDISPSNEEPQISIVGRVDSGTIWGNEVEAWWPYEFGTSGDQYNVTVSENLALNATWAFSLATCGDAVFENNTFTNCTNPFSEDGGHTANSEWIGTNTYDGTPQDGWVGPESTTHGPYSSGSKPQTFSPYTE